MAHGVAGDALVDGSMGDANGSDANGRAERGFLDTAVDRVRRALFGTSDDADRQSVATSGDDSPSFDQMSDERRVVYHVEQRGGRIKQSTIASETCWSDSKVSRLLGEMEADGTVERVRVGREKVVSFVDEES